MPFPQLIIINRLGPRSVQSTLFIFSGLLMMASITLHETLPKEEALETTGEFLSSTPKFYWPRE